MILMHKDCAKEIAQNILIYISKDETLLKLFLKETGFQPHNIRESINNDSFLAHLIDFIRRDDATLSIFCIENKIDIKTINQAFYTLSGAQEIE